MRSRKRQIEVVVLTFRLVVGALFVLATSIGFCLATALMLKADQSFIIELLLWAVFLFWQLIPLLFEGYSPGLNFREVARYPVSLRLYILLNAAYGLFDPAAIAGLLWLLSMWLGILFSRPEWALPAALLFVLFAAFNVLCNRIVIQMFERFQSTRKGRERMVSILLLLMLLPQMINLIAQGWFNSHRRFLMPQWIVGVILGIREVAPPDLLAAVLQPGNAQRLFSLTLFLTYLLLAAFLQIRQLRAVYQGEIYAESFKVQGDLKVKPGWRLPGLDESVSAIVEKELRYIRQNSRLLVMLAYPLIFFGFMLMGAPARRFSFATGGNTLAIFAGLLALSVSNMSYNTFGMDREGFGRWLLSPLSLQKVMRAKNIAQGALMFAIYLAGAAAIMTIRHVPLLNLAAVTAGFLCLLIIHLGAGNLFSVYWPKRIEMAQMSSRMASNAAGFASLLVLLPVSSIVGLVVLATWMWNLTWLPLAAGLAGLALSLQVYSWFSNWAARHAQDHLEEIAGTLGV